MLQKILSKNLFLEIFLYRFFSFKGRSSRKEFAIRILIPFIIVLLFSSSLGFTHFLIQFIIYPPLIILSQLHYIYSTSYNMSLILNIVIIFYTIQVFFVTHRRLHDLNANGWWQLIAFIAFGQILMIGLLLFFKGTDGPNKYGPPPEY